MSYGTAGKLYFFPTSWNSVVVFYNKDLFDRAGVPYPSANWTWDDFLKAAKALTKRDADGKVTQYGYFVPGYNFGLTPWLLTNDTDKLKNQWHESNAKDPKFRESMQFVHDLIHVHKVAPGFEKGVGDAQFAAKQVAMFSAGHWPVPTLLSGGLKNVGVQTRADQTQEDDGVRRWRPGHHAQLEEPRARLGVDQGADRAGGTEDVRRHRSQYPGAALGGSRRGFSQIPVQCRLFYATAASAVPIASPSNFSEVEDIFMRNVELYLTDNATWTRCSTASTPS